MTVKASWRPSASIELLRQRAKVNRSIREYFEQTNALEVETPIISAGTACDVYVEPLQTSKSLFLRTSPELAMKRLLCHGGSDMYQLGKVFREDESGRFHNPEFTLLEWYRLGIDEYALIKDVTALIHFISPSHPVDFFMTTYKDAFINCQLPDPHTAPISELRRATETTLSADSHSWSKGECLDALMSGVVEPSFEHHQLTYVTEFPIHQAALAQIERRVGESVARRFELYWSGIELANGYFELTDVREQRLRMTSDLDRRATMGLPDLTIDGFFLEALEEGLPMCSGVALGVDRLLMILSGAQHISDVLSFSIERS